MFKDLFLMIDKRTNCHYQEIKGITFRPNAQAYIRRINLWDINLQGYRKSWVKLYPIQTINNLILVEIKSIVEAKKEIS